MLCAAVGQHGPFVFRAFFYIVLRPPRFTLFPYTTLFRSHPENPYSTADALVSWRKNLGNGSFAPMRSEEHTSELQSQFHLVCRLLLEKKKHLPSDIPVH